MVNLHLKQRALARLRYRPGFHGAYASTGTVYVPNDAPEWRALQGAPDPDDLNPPNPDLRAPLFDPPVTDEAELRYRRRQQAKIAWIVFIIGVWCWLIVAFFNYWKFFR